jgi:hypothetical protein
MKKTLLAGVCLFALCGQTYAQYEGYPDYNTEWLAHQIPDLQHNTPPWSANDSPDVKRKRFSNVWESLKHLSPSQSVIRLNLLIAQGYADGEPKLKEVSDWACDLMNKPPANYLQACVQQKEVEWKREQAKYAAEHPMPKFETLNRFGLTCENTQFRNNNPSDRSHVWFEIVPSEWAAKMTNEKGEVFTFKIEKVQVTQSNARNEFGHDVLITYPAFMWFKDNAGKWRHINMWSSSLNPYDHTSYIYAPGGPNNQGPADTNWAGYKCIISNT